MRATLNQVRAALRDGSDAERDDAIDALERLRMTGGPLMRWLDGQNALAVAERERDQARQALLRIAENAEGWHGPPPPEGSGHVRALAVIAEWARAALAEGPQT